MRGSRPGEHRGGRRKGTLNRETIARNALLALNGFAIEPKRGEARNGVARERYFRRVYGMTIEDFERLVEAQGNRCAICRTDKPGHWTERWSVDHDHQTGRVRGLLCHTCNMLVGQIERRGHLIPAAQEYIARYAAPRASG